MDADEIIALLELEPHPEGGYFKETFRDSVQSSDGRAASTAIYFVLRAGEVSRWHKVDASEMWHWYAGAALKLSISPDAAGPVDHVQLGMDWSAGQRPQAVVPAHFWQQAQSLGDWTLVGCTVAPGFEFSGFEMASAEFNPG
ncbi:MAG: cupin domain-containing protein [Hyphomicrobiaceae bacterium TMED74]|nr:cupin [Filomicrobium sp.]RPG40350.1 MAG: cupin domain-containing protein [Hyphomicrobiaceae bacterium TMED74]